MMKKLLVTIFTLFAMYGMSCESFALTRYTTYDRYGNRTRAVNPVFPNIVTRYDSNGRKIGTYITNRNYNSYRYPTSNYIPTNRVMNRTYYYNNTYNPAFYRYNGGLGGLKSYDRFGRRIR